jgi:hypothetical protein
MSNLREPPSGAFLEGDEAAPDASPGDVVLVWDPATSTWVSRKLTAGGSLAPAPMALMPLAWDADAEEWTASHEIQLGRSISPVGLVPVVSVSSFGVYLTPVDGVTTDYGFGVRGVGDFLTARCTDAGALLGAFFGATPTTRQSVTGATDPEALDSLIAALVTLGLITDDRP